MRPSAALLILTSLRGTLRWFKADKLARRRDFPGTLKVLKQIASDFGEDLPSPRLYIYVNMMTALIAINLGDTELADESIRIARDQTLTRNFIGVKRYRPSDLRYIAEYLDYLSTFLPGERPISGDGVAEARLHIPPDVAPWLTGTFPIPRKST